MAGAVAEVDGPGEGGGVAAGVVVEAGEEAADASDGHAEDEGEDVEVAGGEVDADAFFGEFDAGPATEESADDGFSAKPGAGVAEVREIFKRGLGPGEDFGAEGGAEDGADDEPHVLFEGDRGGVGV